MISLKRSVSELDRLESLQKVSLECYSTAVEASGRNAVEIDPEATRRFREEVEALSREVRGARSAETLRETRAAYLGALADYAGKATRYLRSLREKLTSTGRVLAELVESVQGGSNDDRRLQLGLGQLHSIAQDPEIARVCPELASAVETVEQSVEQIRKRNQRVVVGLREEIGSLRTSLDSAREAASHDPVSGVLNRNSLLGELRRALAGNRGFCMVFIWVSNLEYLHRRYGSGCRDELLVSFARQLLKTAGSETVCGRWAEDRFAVLVYRPKPEAVWAAEGFSRQLGGPYPLRRENRVREIKLQLRTGVIEAPAGATEARVLKDADKLLIALDSVAAPNY